MANPANLTGRQFFSSMLHGLTTDWGRVWPAMDRMPAARALEMAGDPQACFQQADPRMAQC
jgi:hypothetical protein